MSASRRPTRAATQQLVAQIRGLAVDGEHQRRPQVVAVVRAVDVGAVRQEQVHDVASLALNGDVAFRRYEITFPSRRVIGQPSYCPFGSAAGSVPRGQHSIRISRVALSNTTIP